MDDDDLPPDLSDDLSALGIAPPPPTASPGTASGTRADDLVLPASLAKAGAPAPAKGAESAAEPVLLAAGTRVGVLGLKGAPQHNGKEGVVLRYDGAKGRYAVRLDGKKKQLSVRPANVEQLSLQRGFLDSAAAEKREPDEDEVIEVLTPGARKDQFTGVLPEVQSAMAESMAEKKDEWMTPDFMKRISSNPKLLRGFQHPQFNEVLAMLKEDPNAARERFGADPAIAEFMTEFCAVMGDNFQRVGDAQEQKQQEAAAAKAAQEGAQLAAAAASIPPEAQRILQDPEMQQVLQACSQPGALPYFLNDPRFRPRLDVLIKHGVVQLHS